MNNCNSCAIMPFSGQQLKTLAISNGISRDFNNHHQFDYLISYLSSTEINCSTMLLEPYYIDRDFLIDYTFYYARNLRNQGSNCQRFHFFQNAFTQSNWDQLLSNFTGEEKFYSELQNAYLGFVVFKPLHRKFIGRTILRHYPSESKDNDIERIFSVTRDFIVHINGIELHVPSIPSQQQDTATAAGVTSAIWTAQQKTCHDIGIYTPSSM